MSPGPAKVAHASRPVSSNTTRGEHGAAAPQPAGGGAHRRRARDSSAQWSRSMFGTTGVRDVRDDQLAATVRFRAVRNSSDIVKNSWMTKPHIYVSRKENVVK